MLAAILITGADKNQRHQKIKELIKKIFSPQAIDMADVVFLDSEEKNIKSTKKESKVKIIQRHLKWLQLTANNMLGIKVLVFYSSHLLSIPAQNVLLKTLEEPLENRYLILESPDEKYLLPTILSRIEVIRLANNQGNQTKGWQWFKRNLTLDHQQLKTVTERLASQDKNKIILFLQECQKGLLTDKTVKNRQEIFDTLSFGLKGLNHNLNQKHLLTYLFWQVKELTSVK